MEVGDENGDDRRRASVINPNARPSYMDNGNPPSPEAFDFDCRIRKRLSAEFVEDDRVGGGDNSGSIKTYLRIRPSSSRPPSAQSGSGRSFEEVFSVPDDKTLLMRPPKKHDNIDTCESTFTYTRVFDQNSQQTVVYDECARTIVSGFLDGENGLIFSYGATNSGKTYTMQGYGKDFGIIPRTLEQLFAQVDECLYKKGDIKPHLFDSYVILDKATHRCNSETRARVLRDAKIKPSDMSSFVDSILRSSSSMCSSIGQQPGVPLLVSTNSYGNTTDDESITSLPDKSTLYAIWVSYAEIYNERVYDLFDPVTRGKPRRRELKILQDKKGHVYIKDLTECYVNSAEEAYQFFLAGKQNLQFASTNMNHNSSRSHSFFNIRMVVIGKVGSHVYPKEVRRFSFCDLAGLERTSQTGNFGSRLKESGTINQSLLVLLRCIRAIRDRQRGLKGDVVPYRDSKLTRLFQSHLTSATRISMIVNINPDPEMIDSTVQVIQNSAIASAIRTFKKIAPPCNDSKFFRNVRKSIRVAMAIDEDGEDSEEETPRIVTIKKRKQEAPASSMGVINGRVSAATESELRRQLQAQYDELLRGQREHYEKLLMSERQHGVASGAQMVELALAAAARHNNAIESESSSEDSDESEGWSGSPNPSNRLTPMGTVVRRHTFGTTPSSFIPPPTVVPSSTSLDSPPDNQLAKKYAALLEENQNLRDEVAEMVTTIHALTEAKAEKIKSLKAALEEKEVFATRVGGIKLEMRTLNELLAAKDKQILALKANNLSSVDHSLKMENLTQELEQANTKIEELSRDLSDAENVCVEYDFKLQSGNSTNEELTKQVNSLNHDCTIQKQDLEVLHLLIDTQENTIEKLKAEVASLKAANSKSPVFLKPHPVYGSPIHSPGSCSSSARKSDRPRRVTAKYSMNGSPWSGSKK